MREINEFGCVAIVVASIFLCVALFASTKFFIKKPVFHYSQGERIGVLRKISKKGLVYKTHESELMLNAGLGTVKLDTFNFSVTSDSLALELSKSVGKEIKVYYNEYLIVPYSMGSTSYIVYKFELK